MRMHFGKAVNGRAPFPDVQALLAPAKLLTVPSGCCSCHDVLRVARELVIWEFDHKLYLRLAYISFGIGWIVGLVSNLARGQNRLCGLINA